VSIGSPSLDSLRARIARSALASTPDSLAPASLEGSAPASLEGAASFFISMTLPVPRSARRAEVGASVASSTAQCCLAPLSRQSRLLSGSFGRFCARVGCSAAPSGDSAPKSAAQRLLRAILRQSRLLSGSFGRFCTRVGCSAAPSGAASGGSAAASTLCIPLLADPRLRAARARRARAARAARAGSTGRAELSGCSSPRRANALGCGRRPRQASYILRARNPA
jgi:hypothetical protein